MSTLINSLAGRLRGLVGDRRRAPRRGARARARLPFTVVLLDGQEEATTNFAGGKSLAGHTRDLSETGLTLLLPGVRIGRMREDERASYYAYLRTLAPGDRRERERRRDEAASLAQAAPAAGQVNAWASITPAQVSEAFERFLREGARPR